MGYDQMTPWCQIKCDTKSHSFNLFNLKA